MPKLNENYLQLKDSYLFSEIAHRTAAYSEKHPDKPVIRLGIGDVTRPLCECAIKALHESVDEMGQAATFKGYGPEQGYAKTRDAIAAYYKRNGIDVDADAIFISDGAKSDTGNITELFGHDNVILIPDPVYRVYVDSNTMCGNKVTLLILLFGEITPKTLATLQALPRTLVVQVVAREDADRLTILLPIRIVLRSFPGFSIIFNKVFAFLFPSSAKDMIRILLTVVMAVSAEEKNAESKINSSNTISCMASPESKNIHSFENM